MHHISAIQEFRKICENSQVILRSYFSDQSNLKVANNKDEGTTNVIKSTSEDVESGSFEFLNVENAQVKLRSNINNGLNLH